MTPSKNFTTNAPSTATKESEIINMPLIVAEWTILIILILLLIAVFIICALCCKSRKQTSNKKAKTIIIKNPMVIPIVIQFYHKNPINPEIDGYFPNLNGIRVDIQNAINLFGKKAQGLYYDIFPNYTYQDINTYTATWTQDELIEFLKEQSDELEYNLRDKDIDDHYDGLIVIISCHGIKDYIITSDYKKVSKTAIHRIFSGKKPLSRKIPRMFIYDCCSGHRQRQSQRRKRASASQGKSIGNEDEFPILPEADSIFDDESGYNNNNDSNKNIEVEHILRDDTLVWASHEENPDFRLVVINAANDGFMSKMNTKIGSYVIGAFCDGVRENIFENNNKRFLHEILDDIQEDLHNLGKQLMVKTYNNKTEWIKFEKNKRGIKKNKISVSLSFGGGNENSKKYSRKQPQIDYTGDQYIEMPDIE